MRSCPALWASAVIFAACTPVPPQSDDPLTDWSPGFDTIVDTDDTDVPTLPGFRLSVEDVVAESGIPMRIHEKGTVDGECAVYPGETAGYQELDCLLEIEELDLFGHGLEFDFSVEGGACEYITWHHYQYEKWEVGYGPTEVSFTLGDGTIYDEVNSLGGRPYCEYNHGFAGGEAPNCCIGSYTLSITNALEGTTTTSGPYSWGGNPAKCYSGAAYIDPEASFTAQGWPTGKIVRLEKEAFQKRYSWPLLATEFFSNVPLSNYYDPADHDGLAPAGLLGAWAVPTYEFSCYDRATELFGHIRLQVREWNQVSEYTRNGDPDTVGTEPGSGTPIDDHFDFGAATPGSTTWMQFSE